jgi:hypothetical protein
MSVVWRLFVMFMVMSALLGDLNILAEQFVWRFGRIEKSGHKNPHQIEPSVFSGIC